MSKKAYLLTDSVKVTFKDNLFIHLIGRRGPTNGVHMTYQMYLKHKSAGYKVEIEENLETESIEIKESNDNSSKESYTMNNGVLHVSGEIPEAQEAPIPLAESTAEDNIPSEEESNQTLIEGDEEEDDESLESEEVSTYPKYSKTQLKKMDKETLITYITNLPSGVIAEEDLNNLDSLDKISLVNLIVSNA